jgi:hypothetical protein
MKKTILFIVLFVLAFGNTNIAKAQLIHQYKKEVATMSYIQFPVQKERKREATFELIEENLLGNLTKKVIKNQATQAALTDKGKIVGDISTDVKNYKGDPFYLIPRAFPADGDVHVEIRFTTAPMNKESINYPTAFHKYVKGGTQFRVLTSYAVYSKPDMQLIYNTDPVWVISYIKNSSSTGSSAGPASMSTPPSGASLDAAKKSAAKYWAMNQVENNFAIKTKYFSAPVFHLKAFKGDVKKQSEETQAHFMELMTKFHLDGESEEFKNEVKSTIKFWEDHLKQYKPGTKKKKEAIINDNTAWCLYYDLAIAHIMLGDENKAKEYSEKASKLRKVESKTITNKKGEKIGETKGMNDPLEQMYLLKLEDLIHFYFSGRNAMDQKFINLVSQVNQKKKANNFAIALATNIAISEDLGLSTINDFCVSEHTKKPKLVSGNIQDDNGVYDYTIKKSILYILTKKYTLKANKEDLSIKTKQSFGSNMMPYKTKKSFGLCYKITHSTTKLANGDQYFTISTIQYDYNGDIIITNKQIRDKKPFMYWLKINDKDALGVHTTVYTIKNNDLKIESIVAEKHVITRNRETKFFSAWFEKTITGQPLATEQVSDEKVDVKVQYSKENVEEDANGEWTSKKSQHQKAQQTITY